MRRQSARWIGAPPTGAGRVSCPAVGGVRRAFLTISVAVGAFAVLPIGPTSDGRAGAGTACIEAPSVAYSELGARIESTYTVVGSEIVKFIGWANGGSTGITLLDACGNEVTTNTLIVTVEVTSSPAGTASGVFTGVGADPLCTLHANQKIVDAVIDDDDWAPAALDLVGRLSTAARHPRHFLNSVVLNR